MSLYPAGNFQAFQHDSNMIIEDRFTLAAPIEEVWAFFLDIERLSKCVPGVEHIEQINESTYEGSLKAKVGPISATFSGVAEIVEQTAPNYIRAAIKAKDKRTASMIKGGFDSTLTALAPDQTEVAYKIDVAVRGKMGQFGQTVIVDTAKAISKIFVANVRQEVEKPEEGSDSVTAVAEEANQADPASADVNIVWVVIKSVFGSIGRAFRNLFSGNQPSET
ncbi:MAG: SRPBCC family protein [Chloroflexota bacterium]